MQRGTRRQCVESLYTRIGRIRAEYLLEGIRRLADLSRAQCRPRWHIQRVKAFSNPGWSLSAGGERITHIRKAVQRVRGHLCINGRAIQQPLHVVVVSARAERGEDIRRAAWHWCRERSV